MAQLKLADDVRVAVGRIARRMRQLYGDSPEGALTITEAGLLSRLEREGPASPSELAATERVTPQAIAPVVRTLENRGLVARTKRLDDGRRTTVTITTAGQRAAAGHQRVVMERLSDALSRQLTAAERKQFAAALPLLNRVADAM